MGEEKKENNTLEKDLNEYKKDHKKDPDFRRNSNQTERNEKMGKNPQYIEKSGDISAYMPVYHVKVSKFKHPIYASIIISGILALIISGSDPNLQDIISEDNPTSGIMYGLFFTISAVVSSVIIYFAVKKKGEIALKYLMGMAFMFLTFMLLLFFGEIIIRLIVFEEISYYIIIIVYMILCGIITIYLIYMFFSGRMSLKLKNAFVLLIGILIGSFMGLIIPTWTTITILIGVSIWDIISVKKGPIRKIMELTGGIEPDFERKMKNGEIKPVEAEIFESSELEIGVGDLAFYSMLTSHILVFMTDLIFVLTENILTSLFIAIIVSIAAAIGILIGSFITINSLNKNKILPGLPMSIFIGLGFSALTGVISYFLVLFFFI
ncbi:MAG: hypothetical protein ACTSWY_01930 [Promethearchaeota archaeon]